jgi:hypothetical protein
MNNIKAKLAIFLRRIRDTYDSFTSSFKPVVDFCMRAMSDPILAINGMADQPRMSEELTRLSDYTKKAWGAIVMEYGNIQRMLHELQLEKGAGERYEGEKWGLDQNDSDDMNGERDGEDDEGDLDGSNDSDDSDS